MERNGRDSAGAARTCRVCGLRFPAPRSGREVCLGCLARARRAQARAWALGLVAREIAVATDRRSGRDRRSGVDRRVLPDRRVGPPDRRVVSMRVARERRRGPADRRVLPDRRSGLERRVLPDRRLAAGA